MKNMHSLLFSLSLLCCISVYAQDRPPDLLFGAAHCLASHNHVWGNSVVHRTLTLNLGYVLDTRSWPGQRVMYVVAYTNNERTTGLVFTARVDKRGGHQSIRVANNARFVIRSVGEDVVSGVDFVEPPLGGNWTVEHLASAIKQIKKGSLYRLPLSEALLPRTDIECSTYGDEK